MRMRFIAPQLPQAEPAEKAPPPIAEAPAPQEVPAILPTEPAVIVSAPDVQPPPEAIPEALPPPMELTGYTPKQKDDVQVDLPPGNVLRMGPIVVEHYDDRVVIRYRNKDDQMAGIRPTVVRAELKRMGDPNRALVLMVPVKLSDEEKGEQDG